MSTVFSSSSSNMLRNWLDFPWPDVSSHLLTKIYRNYKQTRKQAQQVIFPFFLLLSDYIH